ncbi:BQ5605_C001g00571 [Microbotryum silenes-dioicae]|uniref:BQ5605_C001g00571 protein n=1 Tax=Microbotryum silenes-dioicae TaxID=796604 RepID=A0A2X0P0E2_9BASI|nr:BQ5605_C001g00571 [Microbotryum silenes-dioicae]
MGGPAWWNPQRGVLRWELFSSAAKSFLRSTISRVGVGIADKHRHFRARRRKVVGASVSAWW